MHNTITTNSIVVTGCLQSYLYSAGPLSMEDCHNYACQVFEALDFLHQKINVVHADIKRMCISLYSGTSLLYSGTSLLWTQLQWESLYCGHHWDSSKCPD